MTSTPRSGDSERHPLLFDQYEVEKVLGSGAMGVVYLARDLRIGRRVALKMLRARGPGHDDDLAQESFHRLHREAQLSGSLLHPNIVALHEVGWEARRITYLAMEYVEGESLLSLFRRNGALDEAAAIRIASDLLRGLAYAHAQGIIHRDIKPGNVLVSLTGQAKLADFGIARSASANFTELTHQDRLIGTPHYMAPEQIAGLELDARADLFSIGVVLYEMLSGKRPFEGASLTDVLYNVVHLPARPLREAAAHVSLSMAELVHRLLEKKAAYRYDSADTALARLMEIAASPIEAQRATLPPLEVSRLYSPEETPTTPLIRTIDLKRRWSRQLHQEVPSPLVAAVLGSLVLVFGITMFRLQSAALDDRPSAVVSQEQLDDAAWKRQRLAEASLLYDTGAYDEAARRLEQFLVRYPDNPAAAEALRQVELARSIRLQSLRPAAQSPPPAARRSSSRR
jgi:serine/threonine protein kinase